MSDIKKFEFSEMRKQMNAAHSEIIKSRQYRGARESDVVGWLADYVEANFIPKKEHQLVMDSVARQRGLNDRLAAEVSELRWFADQINKYVFPGESDTQDAAFTFMKNLKRAADELANAVGWSLAQDKEQLMRNCLTQAMTEWKKFKDGK